jgi:WXXGXW repeat (2 copies)
MTTILTRARYRLPVLMAGLLMTASCAGGFVAVESGPPPRRVEVIGVAPGPEYVWLDGYWGYTGAEYVWVPGRWAVPPRGHHVWVRDRWEERGNRWHRRRGHWE